MLKVVFVPFTNNMQKEDDFKKQWILEVGVISHTYKTLLQSEMIGLKKISGALPH